MENVLVTIFGLIVAAAAGQIIIPNILLISMRKRLFDIPDARKVHKHPVPRLGGVSFFPVILFVMCITTVLRLHIGVLPNIFFTASIATEMLCMIAGLTMLYLVGIADDLIGVRYRQKFVVQIAAAALLPVAGLYINDFYGLLFINEITPFIGIPLTMLLTVFITNAINLIDGIDGLSSGLCLVALTMLGIFFTYSQLWIYVLLAVSCIGVLSTFFLYNVFGKAERGRKIFMGDTGSLTLGYILSFLIVKFCMSVDGYEAIAGGSPLVIAFSVLLVPCLDVCRVVLGRIRRKANPFKPDKTHIHHKFLAMGFSATHSMLIIQLMSTTFIVVTAALVYAGVNATLIFALDIVVWVALNLWFSRIIRRRQAKGLCQ